MKRNAKALMKENGIDENFIREWIEKDTIRGLSRKFKIPYQSILKYCRHNKIKLKTGRRGGFKHSIKSKTNLSNMFSGKNNPFYGKKHSVETRKKMSENHYDCSGENNPYRNSLKNNPKNKKRASDRIKKRWANYSKEELKAISEKLSIGQQIRISSVNGEVRMPNSKWGWFVGRKCGKVFYRSSWELKYCKYLEKSHLVLTFKLEPFCIPYKLSDGTRLLTRIDFLIEMTNKTKIMVEVKPKGLINYGKNKYKIRAQKRYSKKMGWKYFVLTSVDSDEMDKSLSYPSP